LFYISKQVTCRVKTIGPYLSCQDHRHLRASFLQPIQQKVQQPASGATTYFVGCSFQCSQSAKPDSHIGRFIDMCVFLGHYTANIGTFLPTFRGKLSAPSSGFKNPIKIWILVAIYMCIYIAIYIYIYIGRGGTSLYGKGL